MKKVSLVFGFMGLAMTLQAGAVEITALDCRFGTKYWEANKGVELNLQKGTAQFYKESKKSAEQGVSCFEEGQGLRCVLGEDSIITIADLTAVESQTSANASDLLGVLVGVRSRRADVVTGVHSTRGLFGTSDKDVVCVTR
ncbi:MAG: hypothetical protein AAGB31_14705 [Bdellovibrio sp.]